MSLLARLRNVFRPNQVSDEIEREMAFHLDARAEDLVVKGIPADVARRDARRRFGNYTAQKEATREHNIVAGIDQWLAALRRAWRSLRRTPGFLAIAVCSLAVALGLATTTIAEIDALLHPYVPVRAPENLYSVAFTIGDPAVQVQLTPDLVLPLLRGSSLVDSALAVSSASPYGPTSLRATLAVPPTFFGLLGLKPELGRLFTLGDTAEANTVILTDEVWRSAGRPPLDSSARTLGGFGAKLNIVGVLPRGMSGVIGDFLEPMRPGLIKNPVYLVRVKPHSSTNAVLSIAQTVAANLTAQLNTGPVHVSVQSLQTNPLALNGLHRALMGAAVFILLIACANVSALMLARSVARRREQALKIALGAARRDVIRDVVGEVALVGFLGGLAGVIVANWAIRIMIAVTPAQMRGFGFVDPHWDVRVFAGLLTAVLIVIALASIAPAFYVAGVHPAEPLKDGSPSTTGRPARRFRVLVVGELALAMVLLLGATLISESATKVQTFDFGYDPHLLSEVGAAYMRRPGAAARPNVQPTPVEITDAERESIAESLRSMPQAADAAWLSYVSAEGRTVVSDATVGLGTPLYEPGVEIYGVGPHFIRALGVAISQGRDFVDGDRTEEGAVILDSVAAARLFPAGKALAGMVKLGGEKSAVPWSHVIGVVPHVTFQLPAEAEASPKAVIFVSRPSSGTESYGLITLGNNAGTAQFLVRAKPDAHDALPAAIATLRALVPSTAIVGGGEFVAGYTNALMARRLAAGMFITLSIASLILATAGLFGVLSYIVSQRTREFAVRVALGADRRRIMRLVIRDGLVMALGGTAIGGLVGLGAGFAIYDWLWGVYPVDATALVIAEALLLAVTMASAMLPALRAARANPVDVMRAI